MSYIYKILVFMFVVFFSINKAQSFVLIDNYNLYLDNSGPSGDNAASDFLTPTGSGGNLLDINHFQSNGNSLVIQQASGAGGVVQNGDRFWSIGYLRFDSADVNGFNTGLINLYNGIENSLYFFFQLGGTVDMSQTPPLYNHDAGSISLVVDNDGGIGAANLDLVMNRISDGASFEALKTAFTQDLNDGVFVMPGPGSVSINPITPIAASGIDTGILEIANAAFIPGLSGGEVPTGFNIPNAQNTGDFGNDMAVTNCVTGVIFDEAGTDICSLADSDATLTRYFWAVSGQTTGKDIGDAVIRLSGSDTLILQTLTIGDTADIGVEPQDNGILAGCRITGGRSSAVDWDGTFANADEDKNRYSFGGQVGAAILEQGQWQHNNHSGPDGSFSFHTDTILRVLCSDPGFCIQAREAPFKQLDFEGTGQFNNVKNGSFTTNTRHYVRVHAEDRGEPGKGHKQPASIASCPLPPPMLAMDDLEAFLLGNNQQAVAPFPVELCTTCPDVYQIEIHATEDPTSDIIYQVGGPLEAGNLQIHPPTGAN